jgi:hypothetical protein
VQHAWSGLLAKQDVAGRSLSLLETTATRCSSYTCLLNRRRSTLCSPRTSTPLPRASTLPLRPPAFVCNWGDQAARRGRAAQPHLPSNQRKAPLSLPLLEHREELVGALCQHKCAAQRSDPVSQPASQCARAPASKLLDRDGTRQQAQPPQRGPDASTVTPRGRPSETSVFGTYASIGTLEEVKVERCALRLRVVHQLRVSLHSDRALHEGQRRA